MFLYCLTHVLIDYSKKDEILSIRNEVQLQFARMGWNLHVGGSIFAELISAILPKQAMEHLFEVRD